MTRETMRRSLLRLAHENEVLADGIEWSAPDSSGALEAMTSMDQPNT